MSKNVKNRIMPTILVIIFSVIICIIPVSAKTKEVIIGGEPFGLKLYCKGVMITNFESFLSDGVKVCPAKKSGLKINDIILKANNKEVNTNEQLINIVKNSKGKPVKLSVLRNNNNLYINVKPAYNFNKEYYIGVWVRDSCAGIGTISYYNPDNKTYGALGHGICDIDTGAIMPSAKGDILKADITNIEKSSNNNIGSLCGYFTDKEIGDIKINSPLGLYGSTKCVIKKLGKITVAEKSELKKGNAKILTTINGTEPKYYNIEITDICNYYKNSNRNFVIKITDKRLLSKTGGIVQGMSGSPIIQDGKFTGALTHVFLEDCQKGYCVLAENMVNN